MNPLVIEDEAMLADIVRSMRTVAVVGIKDGSRPDEPAYDIPVMLERLGREVIGINPMFPEALGRPTLPNVGALTAPVDVLNVFRRIAAIPELTDQILAMPKATRPRTVWFQSGIRHDPSAERLAAEGMQVVQDHCLGVYAMRYR